MSRRHRPPHETVALRRLAAAPCILLKQSWSRAACLTGKYPGSNHASPAAPRAKKDAKPGPGCAAWMIRLRNRQGDDFPERRARGDARVPRVVVGKFRAVEGNIVHEIDDRPERN